MTKPGYFRLLGGVILLILTVGCGSSKKTRPQSKAKVSRKKLPKSTSKKSSSKPKAATYTNDRQLYNFVEDWKGTPHKMGGTSRKGVDCSGFVIQVYKQVYSDPFTNRRARDLYTETIPLKRSELKEGDLVFFKIRHRYIDHVGIYLSDGKFVHVSSKKGVMISSLNENYFKKYFFAGGRKKS